MRYWYLLVLALFVPTISAVSQAPTWAYSPLIQAGIKTIVDSGTHQDLSNDYTYTYNPAFTQDPFTALGIVGMEVLDLHEKHLKYKVNIPNYTSFTELTVRMNFPTETAWRYFKVSYIAIDKAFTALKVDYLEITNPPNVDTGVGTRTCTGDFNLNIGPLQIDHTHTIIPLLVGIDSTSVAGEHTALWTLSLKDQNTVSYELIVKYTVTVAQITSYILIVDRTQSEDGYEIFLDQIEITGEDNVPNGETLRAWDENNLHLGLGSFDFTLVAFDIGKDVLTLTTKGYYNHIKISVWNYRERNCDPLLPYYQVVSNLCYDDCPSNSVNQIGPNHVYCSLCNQFIEDCQYCTDAGATCTGCWGNFAVHSSNVSCFCPQQSGFYESALLQHQQSIDRCRPCHSFCRTCHEGTENDCDSCPDERTLNGTFCVCNEGAYPNGECMSPCTDPNCLLCQSNSTICDVCAATFSNVGGRCICGERKYYDYDNSQCANCYPACLYCNGPFVDSCIFCDRDGDLRFLDSFGQCSCLDNHEEVNMTCEKTTQTQCAQVGFELNEETMYCEEICGDGILHDLQCDDHNNDNGDGCSVRCRIEENFVCAENSLAPNRRSYCSYQKEVEFVEEWTIKDIYSNTLNITYTMQPTLSHVFDIYFNLTTHISYQPNRFGIEVVEAVYQPESKKFQVSMTYSEDIHEKNITLVFTPPHTAQTFAIPVSRSLHKVGTDNNLPAISYDQSTYANVSVFNVIGMICYIGALIVGIVLLFFRKMMGLELVVMFQLMYFAVILAEYSHPLMGPIQNWEYVNGYNDLNLRGEDSQPVLVDNRFRSYYYYEQFLDNCNGMIIISLCLYGVALITYLLSFITEKSTSKKFVDGAKFFVLEISFSLLVFSLNNIMVCITLQVISGKIGDFSWVGSKVLGIFALVMVLVHTILYGCYVNDLTDSSLYYKRHKKYTHYYPFIFLFRNVLVMLGVILCQTIGNASTYISMCSQAVYILVVLIGRPYRKFIDYVRFCGIELTLLLVLVSRFIEANFMDTQYKDHLGLFFMYSSYIVLVGCVLSFVFTISSFVYHFCRGLKKDQAVAPETSYIPPSLLIPDKSARNLEESGEISEIFSPIKAVDKMPLHSKDSLIEDVLDEATGGSVPNDSIYDLSRQKKFRPSRNSSTKKKKKSRFS